MKFSRIFNKKTFIDFILPSLILVAIGTFFFVGIFLTTDTDGASKADAPIHEDTVLSVTFDADAQYVSPPINIETDRIVIADKITEVEIIADNTLDAPVLLTRDKDRRWFPSEFDLYQLRLPKDALKQVSKDYAEAYGETLPVSEEK